MGRDGGIVGGERRVIIEVNQTKSCSGIIKC